MSNIEINLTPTADILEIGTLNKISCRSWGIASESKMGFLLVHGLGGHSGWFEGLVQRLKVRHIFSLALDLTGFGKRKNSNYVNVDTWLKDIETVFQYLTSIMGDKPAYLLGNSMGGLLALKACQYVKPSGLALLAPAFAGHPKVFPLSYQIKELAKTLVKPDREVILPYGTEAITKEKELITWLDNDPDRRRSVPGKILLDLVMLTQSLRWQKVNLDCPVFLITAGRDEIVDNKISELIYKNIKSVSKDKVVMSNAMHDLTLDLAVEEVADLLANWSNSILQKQILPKESSESRAR